MTYSKFTNLSIVNAHDLVFLGSTQAQTRNEVENEQDNACPEERISEARDGISKLVAQLNVVVVDPAARDLGRAIQVGNVVAAKPVSQ